MLAVVIKLNELSRHKKITSHGDKSDKCEVLLPVELGLNSNTSRLSSSVPWLKMSTIVLEKRERLLIIRFNNPKKKNALKVQDYMEITEVLQDAERDNSISVVAFTGTGSFYTSGNDLSVLPLLSGDEGSIDVNRSCEILDKMIREIYTFPKPLVAVVNGPCIGIGATTAALCDLVYCSTTAYFRTPFTALGLCAEACSSYTFPRILGQSKASEMLLFNHKLSAEEALKFNFVSEIFKPQELETKIWPRLVKFSKLPQSTVKVGKRLIKMHLKNTLREAATTELEALQQQFVSEEFLEGISAFLSKKSKL